jgi:hypothetical protein
MNCSISNKHLKEKNFKNKLAFIEIQHFLDNYLNKKTHTHEKIFINSFLE